MNTMFITGLRHREQKQCPARGQRRVCSKNCASGFKQSSLLKQTGISFSQQYNISVLVFGGKSGGIPNNNTYIFTPDDELSIIDQQIPQDFQLSQNYPNPFNPVTTIRFQLPKHSLVSIKIYNAIGREVRTLMEKDFEPGYHTVTWDGSNNSGIKVSNSVFFYLMETEGFMKVKKALFLK